jgi:hypothetical protein
MQVTGPERAGHLRFSRPHSPPHEVIPMGFFSRLGRLWFFLLFFAFGGYLALTNGDRVDVRLPPVVDSINLPVYLWLAAAFAVGAVAAAGFFGIEHVRRGLKIRRLEKRLLELAPPPPLSANAAPEARIPPVTQEPRP